MLTWREVRPGEQSPRVLHGRDLCALNCPHASEPLRGPADDARSVTCELCRVIRAEPKRK
jgi:hypothetical protein